MQIRRPTIGTGVELGHNQPGSLYHQRRLFLDSIRALPLPQASLFQASNHADWRLFRVLSRAGSASCRLEEGIASWDYHFITRAVCSVHLTACWFVTVLRELPSQIIPLVLDTLLAATRPTANQQYR